MTFALDPAAAPRTARIGTEREPLLLIDGALLDPQRLVEIAAAGSFAPAYGPAGGYPGIRAPMPSAYADTVVRALDPLLRDAFALGDVRLGRAECSFSIVTRPAADLVPTQRAPHVDTVDPLQFAILHYLCDPAHGGTAFYRHRATGYETLTADRLPQYEAVRAGEADPPGYIDGTTPAFEQTAIVAGRWNRLVVYRSRVLHSGQVHGALDPDPRRGRLTANIFLTYRANG
ncbi:MULTISPECIES: DUF6445 family protein [unclassified Sphingomonas]|uniref:DUF6445 family protein n=1 Tax=unclassified Sphingomonas TaxID=196159 RepID=UPI0006F8EEF1|nr:MULTISPECIES: DUF6445 family protein [unclassified Sphingomonas]KQM98182.1 hypothetical protein ASE78_07970 [Sphingomonas sp. Leaf25]